MESRRAIRDPSRDHHRSADRGRLRRPDRCRETERWYPLKVKEWWTSEPPHGVGSTRRARITVGWFTTENDAVATVFGRPTRAVMRGTSQNAPFEATLRFEPAEPVAAGTRVDVTIELSLRGPARLVGGIFALWYGRSWERGLSRLKVMMEAGDL